MALETTKHLNRLNKSNEINVAKWYLIISLLLGSVFAITAPMLSAPDDDYHAQTIMYHAHDQVDFHKVLPYADLSRGNLEEVRIGAYFDRFFVQKAPRIKDNVGHENGLPGRGDRIGRSIHDFCQHIFQVFGWKVGFAIYPSIAVATIFARMFAIVSSSFIVYGAIIIVKKWKLFFALFALMPNVIGMMASLSYDSISTALCILGAAIAVNIAIDLSETDKIDLIKLVPLVIISIALNFFAKENTILFNIIYIPIIIALAKKSRLKNTILPTATIVGFLGLAMGVLFYVKNIDYCVYLISKVSMTFLSSAPWVQSDFDFFNQRADFPQSLPFWLLLPLYIMMFMTFKSEKVKINKMFSFVAIAIFVLNYIGVFLPFANADNELTGLIQGPQGRYFSIFLPVLCLAAPLFQSEMQSVTVDGQVDFKRKKRNAKLCFLLAAAVLVLMIIKTIICAYYLKVGWF
jgi:uncharacterized membrane protein